MDADRGNSTLPIIRSTGATTAAGNQVDPDGLDLTYGVSLSDLERCVAPPLEDEPSDFDAFWADLRAQALAVDPAPVISPWRPWRGPGGTPEGAPGGGHEIAELHFASLDGARIGGWLVRPADGADRIAVCGHGYGGRDEPACDDAAPSALSIFPVARGLPTVSTVPGIGREAGEIHHVVWGIDSPRTYAVITSVADYLVATTVARSLLPGAESTVYHGASFGGGVGAMLLAIDDRFDGGLLGLPTFGNQPVRVTQRGRGSGQVVREHVAEHPEALETLRYADAASAARRVRVPVFATPALADGVVPPPGQFAVTNSLAGPVWRHVLSGGHGAGTEQEERRSADPRRWSAEDDGTGTAASIRARPTPGQIDDFLRSPEPLPGTERVPSAAL